MKIERLSRMRSDGPIRYFVPVIWTMVAVLALPLQCHHSPGSPAGISKPGKEKLSEISPAIMNSDSALIKKVDSLEFLLRITSNDTSRLRILNALAGLEKDDSVIAIYNEQVDVLVARGLAAKPPEEVRNAYLKFRASNLLRKGDISMNEYDFSGAQKHLEESLRLSETTGNTAGVARACVSLGNNLYYQGRIQEAIPFYEKAIMLSEETGDRKNLSRALNNLGIMYSGLDEIPRALEYLNRNLKLQEELGDQKSVANTLNNIGITYSYQGDMPHALEYYSRALKIGEKTDDRRLIASTMQNIGTIYQYQKDFPASLEYYGKSLKIQEELGDKNIVAAVLNNMGNVFIDQAEELAGRNRQGADSLRDLALENYFRSLVLCEETGDKATVPEILINIGQTLDEQAEAFAGSDRRRSDSLRGSALGYYSRSLRISEETGDKSSIAFALVRIGSIYLGRNEIPKALGFAKKAYAIAKETGYTFNIKDAAELLDKIYVRQENYRLARKYYGEYIEMRDSIEKEENQQLVQKKYYQYLYEKKAATDSISHSHEMRISQLEIEKRKAESRRQKLIIMFVAAGFLLTVLLAVFIQRSLRITRRQKKIIEEQKKEVDDKNRLLNEQNEEISSQRDEIEAQRDTVMEQKKYIEEIHDELTGSIRYAGRIQKAVLPSEDHIGDIWKESGLDRKELFILYKPRDIVSGDFYYFEKKEDTLYVAVADCTGHGVPGAVMSMLGVSLISEVISGDVSQKAGRILDALRERVIHSLQQKGVEGEQKDGLDMACLTLHLPTRTISYAGANTPLYIVHAGSGEMQVIPPDPMPVAIYESMESFTTHEVQLKGGDILYLSTDGFGDQFGGPRGKKFLTRRLRELLLEISHQPMNVQKELLDRAIEDWKHFEGVHHPQTDDITLVGMKIG